MQIVLAYMQLPNLGHPVSPESGSSLSLWSKDEGPPVGQTRRPLDPAAVATTSLPIC